MYTNIRHFNSTLTRRQLIVVQQLYKKISPTEIKNQYSQNWHTKLFEWLSFCWVHVVCIHKLHFEHWIQSIYWVSFLSLVCMHIPQKSGSIFFNLVFWLLISLREGFDSVLCIFTSFLWKRISVGVHNCCWVHMDVWWSIFSVLIDASLLHLV